MDKNVARLFGRPLLNLSDETGWDNELSLAGEDLAAVLRAWTPHTEHCGSSRECTLLIYVATLETKNRIYCREALLWQWNNLPKHTFPYLLLIGLRPLHFMFNGLLEHYKNCSKKKLHELYECHIMAHSNFSRVLNNGRCLLATRLEFHTNSSLQSAAGWWETRLPVSIANLCTKHLFGWASVRPF